MQEEYAIYRYLDSAVEGHHDVTGSRNIQRATASDAKGGVWSHIKTVRVDNTGRCCIHALNINRELKNNYFMSQGTRLME